MTKRNKDQEANQVKTIVTDETQSIGDDLQIWKNGILSSGETTLLEKEQDKFNTYRERVVEFDNTATLLLAKCGFYSLYSGYAYDALLKLILSCGDSKGLFQFIWQVKTGTYDPDNITEI